MKCKNDQDFWYRGGCTILIDMKTKEVRYCIYKSIDSEERYKRQQDYYKKSPAGQYLRSIYFGGYDLGEINKTFSLLNRDQQTEE